MKTRKKQGQVNFRLGDFLIRLKNAGMANYKEVRMPVSKLVLEVAKLLEKEGYLSQVKKDGSELHVSLAYFKKEPVFSDIKLVSKPGLRIYMDAKTLAEKRGPSFYIISTSKGLMTAKEAIKGNFGGEVLAEIF